MIVRKMVNFPKLASFFLFGPRQTGKTTLVKEYCRQKTYFEFNFLLRKEFSRYVKNPSSFRDACLYQIEKNKVTTIFVDEVQKIPEILDEVHALIEEKKVQFILSGSSARKLKRNGANLLGGRALLRYLYPLTQNELQEKFVLEEVLRFGSLPGIYFSDEATKRDQLVSYVEVYLKEEIQEEALVRKIGDFHRFLEVAAQHVTEMVNYENIGRESATSSKTVKSYFQILEDTLIGHLLPPWDQSVRKQLAGHPKFYFFDCGVSNALVGSFESVFFPEIRGKIFEQWVVNEVIAHFSYSRSLCKIYFWRTKAGNEVDLLIAKANKPFVAIEIKAKKLISQKDLSGLLSLREEFPDIKKLFVVCEEEIPRLVNSIEILPWKIFLQEKILELGE